MSYKSLSGLKILMVIAPLQFRDEELLVPRKLFIEAGACVEVASTKPGPAEGMLGASIQPDMLIKDVEPASYDAVVVVGGMGSPEYLWENKELHKILQDMDKSNKVVSGICLSSAVLARAGVLQGRKATVWATAESLAALKQGGADYLKQPLVYDGRTITAQGPEAAVEFAQAIVQELSGKQSRV